MGNNGKSERYQVENQIYDFSAVLNCSLPQKSELNGSQMSIGFQLTK
jgi:hypothetical protein